MVLHSSEIGKNICWRCGAVNAGFRHTWWDCVKILETDIESDISYYNKKISRSALTCLQVTNLINKLLFRLLFNIKSRFGAIITFVKKKIM